MAEFNSIQKQKNTNQVKERLSAATSKDSFISGKRGAGTSLAAWIQTPRFVPWPEHPPPSLPLPLHNHTKIAHSSPRPLPHLIKLIQSCACVHTEPHYLQLSTLGTLRPHWACRCVLLTPPTGGATDPTGPLHLSYCPNPLGSWGRTAGGGIMGDLTHIHTSEGNVFFPLL